MAAPRKLSDEQRKEILQRYNDGQSQMQLARDYGVARRTITLLCRSQPGRPMNASTGNTVEAFAKRVRSVLWRQDSGADKKTYDAWTARVSELESSDGAALTHNQAVVRASKEYPCLHRLFQEYDILEFDPNPESHPEIRYFGKASPGENFATVQMDCQGKNLSYRESLRWALDAAGAYLRTGQQPETCPCDAAWYLYRMAVEEPKEFLAKVGQIESKNDGDEDRRSRRAGQRSVEEIEAMLDELEAEEDGAQTNYQPEEKATEAD